MSSDDEDCEECPECDRMTLRRSQRLIPDGSNFCQTCGVLLTPEFLKKRKDEREARSRKARECDPAKTKRDDELDVQTRVLQNVRISDKSVEEVIAEYRQEKLNSSSCEESLH